MVTRSPQTDREWEISEMDRAFATTVCPECGGKMLFRSQYVDEVYQAFSICTKCGYREEL